MSFQIRKATQKDMPRVLELINELAIFEKEPDAVEITVDDLITGAFQDPKQFDCFVAECESNVEGIALVYHRFSTWKGNILHLEDLIVSQNKRGSGLGTALLDAVVTYGDSLKVKRISWEVIDWNEPAIAFYEKKGAHVMRDWDVVQLDEKGIKNYLANI
ncbi:GNAT family N-acetyltransferase [Psychroserpens sp. Hel_I_66]|uniref:GNAT family N-acetyltransferase n=1 Tax=Psychroserpens sp. Hel_I_66 TaxID=1250004 RepID=UPI0006454E05|nr:GNAT family N-acetyltransferase [Psychroserpens sp. Hel_I_66]